MKFLILSVCVAMVAADVSDRPGALRSLDVGVDGAYYPVVKTDDGIVISVSESRPLGAVIQLTYIADENGPQPQPQDLHIPTDTIPQPITRALQDIRDNTPERLMLILNPQQA